MGNCVSQNPLRSRADMERAAVQLIEPLLTEQEKAVLHRGKNANKATVAKHASVEEYRTSTGFECLLGWLYLKGRNERIMELMDVLWREFEPETQD